QLDRDPLKAGGECDRRLRHARPGADNDDRRERGVEIRQPVQLSDRNADAAQGLIEQADVRLVDEAPHDRDDHRWYRPRDEREGPREPQEVEPLLEQDREAESEDVLEERRRERPDDSDLEGLPEQVVAEEARAVVEERRREIDIEPGLR